MFYLSNFCCICLCNKKNLTHVSAVDSRGLSYDTKLLSSLQGMVFTQINKRRLLCAECCDGVNFIYEFHHKCVTGGITLNQYLAQLKAVGKTEAVLSIPLTDVTKSYKIRTKSNSEYEIYNEGNSNEYESDCVEHMEILPDICHVEIKTESSDLEIENTVEEVTVPPICPTNIKAEILDLKIETTVKRASKDIEHVQDPLINVDDGSDIDSVGGSCALDTIETVSSLELSDYRNTNIRIPQKDLEQQMQESEENVPENHSVLSCNLCGKIFSSKLTLSAHTCSYRSENMFTPTRTGIKQHKCVICQKTFTQSSGLKQHMMKHTGARPYECSICPKKFCHSTGLKQHMFKHTGVKPHECIVCQKKFSDASSLRRHVLIHTGVKPYECNLCHKKFNDAGNFRKHTLVHTGARPHECSVCQKKFSLVDNLKRHMTIHNKVARHECRVCHTVFGRAHNLNLHMLMHTDGK